MAENRYEAIDRVVDDVRRSVGEINPLFQYCSESNVIYVNGQSPNDNTPYAVAVFDFNTLGAEEIFYIQGVHRNNIDYCGCKH